MRRYTYAANIFINPTGRDRCTDSEADDEERLHRQRCPGAMGFENPQAIYKWISGKSLPSLDNFLILSRLLHASIEDILVVDGDIVMSALFETIEDAVSESGELAYVISLLKGFY